MHIFSRLYNCQKNNLCWPCTQWLSQPLKNHLTITIFLGNGLLESINYLCAEASPCWGLLHDWQGVKTSHSNLHCLKEKTVLRQIHIPSSVAYSVENTQLFSKYKNWNTLTLKHYVLWSSRVLLPSFLKYFWITFFIFRTADQLQVLLLWREFKNILLSHFHYFLVQTSCQLAISGDSGNSFILT